MRLRKIGLSLLFLCLSTLAIGQVSVTRGPYLQNPTSVSMVVRWRTDVATTGTVRYGTSPTNLTQTATEPAAGTEHIVKLQGLSPSTGYFYQIGDGSVWHTPATNNYRFTTSPVPGSTDPVRIWAIGDFGKGNTYQQMVKDAFLNYNGGEAADVWLWLGDNVYDDGLDSEYQAKVFDSTNGFGGIFPYMPFSPCPGNHDYLSIAPPFSNTDPNTHSGAYYDLVSVPTTGEAGGVPSNTELYYSFDYGNVHFLSLNSEIGSLVSSSNDWIGTFPYINPFASNFSSSPFTQWLHADLTANTQRWTVAYFHQPPYTDGSHDATSFWEVYMKAMRENIVPILDQYGVDLVLAGHSHVYERSFLIKGHYDDPGTWNPNTMLVDGNSGIDSIGEAYVKDLSQANGNEGTVFIVCGNSASKDDNPNLQYPAMYTSYGCDTCVGSLVLDVHGDTLRGRFLDAYDNLRDDFTIYKLNVATNTETEKPEFGLELVPNPTDGEFRVELTTTYSGKGTLRLLDPMGRVISHMRVPFSTGTQTLQPKLPFLSSGTYFAVFESDGKSVTRRLVVK